MLSSYLERFVTIKCYHEDKTHDARSIAELLQEPGLGKNIEALEEKSRRKNPEGCKT